ncbi:MULTISPECIES: phosphoenolpyruvate--protein phosphotransferase [Cellulomonas]|uniref:Phosphoenolpyruvate-protein phosphotransferase n=1 Tax=Cellulomonas gelida TaxID=1712 RepID=A0A4Y3KGW3_9CELL|nr:MULTISPECIES: phosphoenolpyruvate--protein phosphotransferase [Cellulomonas]MCR6706249.1 phosphoenolpyruvate--protein phosphotransferase [Cellulomonas sp.]GEA83232.1 phosphoenolpyruvate-protein phosphotransferase [Cellulomonas gelida]GGL29139.1 phosphoenolpyruvate-protein phosphotransferase [Cellulomonas gelida]
MSTTPSPTVLQGLGVSPGRVVAPAVLMPPPVTEPPSGRRLPPSDDHRAAADRIALASERVRAALDAAADGAEGDAADVLHATAAIAADPTLVADAVQRVMQDHLVPERAVWEAAEEVAAQFEALGGLFAERTRDIHDVRDRLVADLTGRPAPGIPQRDEPFVLVAVDLAPALVATLDTARVLAIATSAGGPTAHTAILARARGIPAVVAARGLDAQVTDGDLLVVDGGAGTVTLHPDDDQVARAKALAAVARTFDGDGRTADGRRVELLANVGAPADAADAAAAGAQGVGLFRTEFEFLDRDEAPSIDEQVAAYRQVFAAFAGRKVVIRTLDAGADKPLPFLTADDEANPALGVRGLRTAATHPEVLEDQLTAIARAAAAETADVWVMAPMVATVAETEDFVARCAQHGLTTAGVMVEVPSAALVADRILAHAAFASIGTNDLTQYAMAADRLLGAVAHLSDAWHPAVLRLVAETCRGGAAQGRPVGVCGEAAAVPALAVVLVGLGVSSLSMTPRAIADVAAVLQTTTYDECVRLATLALAAESAADARETVRAALPVLAELGL